MVCSVVRFSTAILVLVNFISFIGCMPILAQSIDNKTIDHFIENQAVKRGGIENKKSRKIIRADINGDGKRDAVVLYILEGFNGSSNLSFRYLTIFVGTLNRKLKYITQKTIKYPGVDLRSIVNERINLGTLDYFPSDARCCPSKKGHIQMAVVKNRLKQVY